VGGVAVHAGTVVPQCFKDDNASQWKSGKFDPRSLRNPWTDRHQNLHGWLVGDPYPYAKFHHDTITSLRPSPPLQICENAHQVTRLVFFGSSDSIQPRPLDRFSRSIRQMTRFRARMCLLGVPKTKFYISTPFSPQNRKFWPIFDVKKASTTRMLACKLPWIVIVAK